MDVFEQFIGELKMSRLPYIDVDELDPKDRDLLKLPLNLYRKLANSPDGARAFRSLGHHIRFTSTLNPRLREMAIIQVGYLAKSEYEYAHHVHMGLEEFGLSEDDIRAITSETKDQKSQLPNLDRVVLRAARDMFTNLKISDQDFKFLENELSHEHVVELVLAIAFYCAVVRVLATLEIDTEPDYRKVLKKFPLAEY
tara:strand:+ start:113 stop:703 length:591 start_codon:yes stop_codon:yes gene_type:complete